MKNLIKNFNNIVALFVRIISFGLIKLNKNIRKEYRVELLKVKLNECQMQKKENMDRAIEIAQEKAVHKNNLSKLTKEKKSLVKNLEKYKNENNMDKFNELAIIYKSRDSMINEEEKIIKAYDEAEEALNKNIRYIEQNINKLKCEIDIIEAKQKTYESMKGINDTLESININTDANSAFNVSEIKQELEDDLIRETTKTEIIQKNVPLVEIKEYSTNEEMEEFLKSIK